MENIINKIIKLKNDTLYLEKDKPKFKPSSKLTRKAAKRKRKDSPTLEQSASPAQLGQQGPGSTVHS